MTKHRLLTLLLTAAIAAAMIMVAGPREKKNILSLKNSITDEDIVFPESFDTDVHKMMTNWYLQNYTVLDADVENKNPGEVGEETYIRRLAAIPSVIEMPYNQVVRRHIERYVYRSRTLVEQMLGMSLYYMPIFEQALEKEGLPLELKYLPIVESALDPNATSRVGAAGLWQFMIGTGKGLGLEVNSLVDERRDPYRSSAMAAKYLKNLYQIYNDWSPSRTCTRSTTTGRWPSPPITADPATSTRLCTATAERETFGTFMNTCHVRREAMCLPSSPPTMR